MLTRNDSVCQVEPKVGISVKSEGSGRPTQKRGLPPVLPPGPTKLGTKVFYKEYVKDDGVFMLNPELMGASVPNEPVTKNGGRFGRRTRRGRESWLTTIF